jgi:hypothetical protein
MMLALRTHVVPKLTPGPRTLKGGRFGLTVVYELLVYKRCISTYKPSFNHPSSVYVWPKKMHANWHTQFRTWHEVEITCTTRHVTLSWHFRRRCRCLFFLVEIENSIAKEPKIQPTQLKQCSLSGNQEIMLIWGLSFQVMTTFIFFFSSFMWQFGFEVECQMKFVKHTRCWLCSKTSLWHLNRA